MKITYKNYPKEIQKINWRALPKNLKDLKEDMQEFYELYNDDTTIKETFDLFLKRLNQHLNKKTPAKKEKECKESTVKKPRNKTKPKATRKPRLSLPQVNITEVDFYKDEYRLLRRFYNMITKKQAVTFRSIQLLYMTFQKTAVSRKVRKTAGSADLFNTCNEKLTKLFQSTATSKETVKIKFSDKKVLKQLEEFVKGQKIDTAVSLIGRVINLQGTAPEEAKVKRLITSIDNAIEKDKISKNNRLYKELVKCKKDLNAYLKGSSKRIALKPQELTGARKKSSYSCECG